MSHAHADHARLDQARLLVNQGKVPDALDLYAAILDANLREVVQTEVARCLPALLGTVPSVETGRALRRLFAAHDFAGLAFGPAGERAADAGYAVLRGLQLLARQAWDEAIALLDRAMIFHSQHPVIQGLLFEARQGRRTPEERARFDLADRFCPIPFRRFDVLPRGDVHICCSSYLPTPVGNLFGQDWPEAWNSPAAQSIRQSIHDGSFDWCNKITCPSIATGRLPARGDVEGRERAFAEKGQTQIEAPTLVNLSYDRSCNLSCPSCRTEPFAADGAERDRLLHLTERTILPLLRRAELAMITGSGEPFASKAFRQILARINDDEFPSLKIILMTNGLLFTPEEWSRFPGLHRKLAFVRVSIDAATARTYSKLRRGGDFDRLLVNLRFIAGLARSGAFEDFVIAFVVQHDNFLEMPDFVRLGQDLGATRVAFTRMTNWGTFPADDYDRHAVWIEGHPRHREFLAVMADPRLRDPLVELNDLCEFLPAEGR